METSSLKTSRLIPQGETSSLKTSRLIPQGENTQSITGNSDAKDDRVKPRRGLDGEFKLMISDTVPPKETDTAAKDDGANLIVSNKPDKNYFDSKEIDILTKIKQFFSHDTKCIRLLLKIINGDSELSIRIIDWFVANYSKGHDTCYKIKINGKEEYFYVHTEYKNQLNGFSKVYFDPFCRKRKISYHYKNDKMDITFITSIGQLNFFKWAIRNKVITYVLNNLNKIEIDMKFTNNKNKEKKISSESPISVENEIYDLGPDPNICSSESLNSMCISPPKSGSRSNSESKRQQLSKSVYDYGIKKSCITINLDFD